MGFTIAARTILELGKELISSDDIALYELIKNAVDAKSDRVQITVNLALSHSDFVEANRRINDDSLDKHDVVNFVHSRLIETPEGEDEVFMEIFEVDSKENMLKELEMFYVEANYIKIRDTGHGMSLEDLTTIFLRIGTKSRQRENIGGARNLGDKGIGRLSAMRLGDRLRVQTARKRDRNWNLLEIDWSKFTHDSELDVTDIELEPRVGERKSDMDEQGTTIRISGLQADWDKARFTDILQGRIARMIDPFNPGQANRFIVAKHNDERILVPSIPRELLRAAHAFCRVEFRVDEGIPTLEGEIDYRYRQKKKVIFAQGAEISSLTKNPIKRRAKRGHAAFMLVDLPKSAFESLGNFQCEIYWFNRRVIDAIEGLTEKAQETSREISNWSGGPMLYRHGFRILPYGDPDDDWLELDTAAFGMSGFKLNRQQVIGRVSIETPHKYLGEMTNREGLIETDSSNALKRILMWVVHTEMRGLINKADELELIQRKKADLDTNRISNTQRRVEATLEKLRENIGDVAKDEVDDLSANIRKLAKESQDLIDRIDAVIKEADQEREKFVYLAGIGLMTEFIFHELERAVSYTMEIITRGGARSMEVAALKDQLITLHKRIAAFDELTGEKRQRKSKFDLVELVTSILTYHEKEFSRHRIHVKYVQPDQPIIINAVRGMVIQILENLIVNSSYWLKQQKQFEPGFVPIVTLTLDEAGGTLEVEDNGPGVLKDRREHIFEPFVTTKPTGQGRGLGLYIARDLAGYHGWKLYMKDNVGSALSSRLNKFVLDMR